MRARKTNARYVRRALSRVDLNHGEIVLVVQVLFGVLI
jgi:hypothetical protein